MSAFLFGTCGCCLGGILGGIQVISRSASVPYNFGWAMWPDGEIKTNPLAMSPPQGIPASIYLTIEGHGVRNSYDTMGNKTITSTDYMGANKYSDPYPFSEAVANAVALMKTVSFGGTFPAYDGKPIRLCFDADAAPGETSVRQVALSRDWSGKIIYDGSSPSLVGGAWAANGAMGKTSVTGWIGSYYDGQVVAREFMIRTPVSLKSKATSWFDFGPGIGIGFPGGPGGGQTIPIDMGPGEYYFAYNDAPARGTMGVGTDPAPALGS